MIKVRQVLCYFSGLVLTLAGIPFITEFIFESQGGQQVQYLSIYPVIGGILMDAVSSNILVVGRDLQVVGWF